MIKKQSLVFAVISLLLAAGLLAGCSSKPAGQQQAPSPAEKKVSIKLAHVGSETHQYQVAAQFFKKELEEKSKGQFEVKIYPSAQLGSEKDAVEGVINGTIDMTEVAPDSSLANIVPEMNVFGVPFLFKDRSHVYKVLDGEIGKGLLAKVDQKGMKGLGYWEVGFRQITTKNKPVTKPEDMKGLKMRVQPAPVWQEFMKSLGANPTPVDFNELYSALGQGVVDGQENPLATIMSMKFYEVQKQVALTNHTYTPAAVLISKKMYDSLTAEQKTMVENAVKAASDQQRKKLEADDAKYIEELKGKGVNVTNPDRNAFAEATKDVGKAVADKVPAELIQKIKDAGK